MNFCQPVLLDLSSLPFPSLPPSLLYSLPFSSSFSFSFYLFPYLGISYMCLLFHFAVQYPPDPGILGSILHSSGVGSAISLFQAFPFPFSFIFVFGSYH